jgi:hypothetical protein
MLFQRKVDHPDKIAKLEGVDPIYFESAEEVNAKSEAIENNTDEIENIKKASSIYTFASEAEVTAKWNELNTAGNPPLNGTTYIRTDLKKYGVWDSSVTAKGVTTDLDVPENLEVKIQEAYVLTQGKTDLTDFEVGDKFRAWLGDRYVVGKVIALLTDTFQNSINDTTKIKLHHRLL